MKKSIRQEEMDSSGSVDILDGVTRDDLIVKVILGKGLKEGREGAM